MILRGEWLLCRNGVSRPTWAAEALTGNGQWVQIVFLVDSGADRTVFSAATLWQLALAIDESPEQLGGVGGETKTVNVAAMVRFQTERGTWVKLGGRIAGFTDPFALDMSILGRDFMSQFAAVVDEPGDVVALVGRGHRCRIEAAT